MSRTEPDDSAEVARLEETAEILRPLVKSPARLKIFETIKQNEGLSNADVAEKAGVSQSTVTVTLQELDEWNIVRREDGPELTKFGDTIADKLIDLSTTVGVEGQLQPFLNQVSHFGSLGFDEFLMRIENVNVVESDVGDLAAPRREYREHIKSATEVRKMFPFRISEGPTYINAAKHGGLEHIGFLMDEGMERRIKNPDAHEGSGPGMDFFEEMSNEGAEIRVSDREFPDFVITISEDEVLFFAQDEKEVVVLSPDEEVRSWAVAEYDRYLESSRSFWNGE